MNCLPLTASDESRAKGQHIGIFLSLTWKMARSTNITVNIYKGCNESPMCPSFIVSLRQTCLRPTMILPWPGYIKMELTYEMKGFYILSDEDKNLVSTLHVLCSSIQCHTQGLSNRTPVCVHMLNDLLLVRHWCFIYFASTGIQSKAVHLTMVLTSSSVSYVVSP